MSNLRNKLAMPVLFLGMAILCPSLQAHEGHDTPGALPPPPHGGVVKEAAHKTAHAGGAPEDELFFEAVYKNKELKVFPLLLKAENTHTFQKMSTKDLAKLELKVENPRSKKTEVVTATAGDDGYSAKFDAKGANRFIVHILTSHNKEEKVAKVQLETH